METVFKNVTVTRENVIRQMEAFVSAYPDPNAYDEWLEKQTYRYIVEYGDRPYPPKHILSQVTGIPTSEFTGGEQTNRVFRELGFKIVIKAE